MISFTERVLTIIKRIPRGKVTTYAAIARALGKPGASRAVGNALNGNPRAPVVPCHRVVRSDGRVGGYASGVAKKIRILTREGVRVKEGRVDMGRYYVPL